MQHGLLHTVARHRGAFLMSATMFLLQSRLLHCLFLFLCAALLLFGISSRSPSPNFLAASKEGADRPGIYLYRQGALAAYAQPFQVRVDGRTVGFIANASYLRLPLSTGSHRIEVVPGGMAQVTSMEVEADADGRRFYEFVFPTGWDMRPFFQGAAIEKRDEQHALEALQGMRRVAANASATNAQNRGLIDDER